MIRILLVDDDYLALNSFFALEDWQALGYDISKEAYTGSDAVKAVQSAAFDIVFLDVHLPDQDGITLIPRLKALCPTLTIIMLSNYSDFAYVREALKSGAADYLLKHEITSESILNVLTQVGYPPIEGHGSPMRNPLSEALEGKLTGSASGIFFTAQRDSSAKLVPAAQDSILKTCRHILNPLRGALVDMITGGSLAVLLPMNAHAEDVSNQLRALLFRYYFIKYTFSEPVVISSWEQLYAVSREQIRIEDSHDISRDLLSVCVECGMTEFVERTVRRVFSHVRANRDIQELPLFLQKLTGSTPLNLYSEEEWMQLIRHAMLMKKNERLNGYSEAVRGAIQVIETSYPVDLDLEKLAQRCYVSYNHLSFLFKKETGQGVNRYINAVRVQRAAMMLLLGGETDLHTAVGFNSPEHYSRVFKQITGFTVSEFASSGEGLEWLKHFHPMQA